MAMVESAGLMNFQLSEQSTPARRLPKKPLRMRRSQQKRPLFTCTDVRKLHVGQ